MTPADTHHLAYAHRLAARGLGRTWPNPSVGCVLVSPTGQILAAARTGDGGRPHAETQALAAAGSAARGATAYVSLEPCAHHGQTPPCAAALIEAGIVRVVIAETDADPRVSGRGVEMLREAGMEVYLSEGGLTPHPRHEAGVPPAASDSLTLRSPKLLSSLATNLGFFRRITHGLPYVALKLATSLDGRVTDGEGTSQWITGEAARAHAHGLRGQHDCVLTGIGTVLADDPQLNVRLPGMGNTRNPRVVCDRQLRLPLTSKLVKTANLQPVWVMTTAKGVEAAASHASDLREAGVSVFVLEEIVSKEGKSGASVRSLPWRAAPAAGVWGSRPPSDTTPILRTLAAQGITRVLVEAGPTLSTAFLAAGVVDVLHWYRAPILLGNAGAPAINALDVALADAARALLLAEARLGVDAYTAFGLEYKALSLRERVG